MQVVPPKLRKHDSLVSRYFADAHFEQELLAASVTSFVAQPTQVLAFDADHAAEAVLTPQSSQELLAWYALYLPGTHGAHPDASAFE